MNVSDLRKKVSEYVVKKGLSKRTQEYHPHAYTDINAYSQYNVPGVFVVPDQKDTGGRTSPIDTWGDYSALVGATSPPPSITNPFTQLPAEALSMQEAALVASPQNNQQVVRELSGFGTNGDIAAVNANINRLTYELSVRDLNDQRSINQLQGKLKDLQNQNQNIQRAIKDPFSSDRRIQLQLIASQMQLQDQALQIQLMLDEYAEKVKQQNAFLLNFQQELNYLKSRLADLDYVMHVIEHTDNVHLKKSTKK